MLLGTRAASTLENILAGQGDLRAGLGTIRVGQDF